ncbi:MAG: NAD(+) synthase, partial [Endomicrobium sp.]|nr:NAD(+) synthase [Endomicrobium sp.]
MKYGFIKTAAVTPEIKLANPFANSVEIIKLITKANSYGVELIVFPELCITGYTCGELFLSDVMIESTKNAIRKILIATINKKSLIFIGSPILYENKLYSCAIAIQNGKILGIIPKTEVPLYSEFYESRYFSTGKYISGYINLCEQNVPFGTKIIFVAKNNDNIKISAEICEDMFAISPPSNNHVKAGASIIVNLSASNEIIGKNEYRKTLIKSQSGRLLSGYIYASAGIGESVSDTIFSGHRIIAESGNILAESKLFKSGITICEIDICRLAFDRRKINVFRTKTDINYNIIKFDFNNTAINLVRNITPLPFVPEDLKLISSRAELILQIQSMALADRLKLTGLDAVIGVSGGLDSCLSLLVILRSYKILNRDKKNIIAVTMPGPGTSVQTMKNVSNLANAFGIKIKRISINKMLINHLNNINHTNNNDVTYENAQARERMQILMDIANAKNGLVVGTSDLSEIALGWCTYNGDHMSMYSVNSSIPKTLVKYIISYESKRIKKYKKALLSVLNTAISPELLPLNSSEISQKTENIIGPFELHDFFLYYTLRFGQTPDKILFLAKKAFKNKYSKNEI